MHTFLNVTDLGDLRTALEQAQEIKQDRYKFVESGRNKTVLLVFFNNSLRTRLSTQKAAQNLGMNVIVLDINAGAWKLETQHGVVMDTDKSEHLLEAIPVMASYCDIIGVRSFARLTDRQYDYAETVFNQFVDYSRRPVFAMETGTVHPLQSFADLITIEEYATPLQNKGRPVKVVLTWAPHPKALPQAVPNSFSQWMLAACAPGIVLKQGIEFVITHPKGYELDPAFTQNARIEYNQQKAFEGADFIYAKNWSCPGITYPKKYGHILEDYHTMLDWTISTKQMDLTNNAKFMHCLPVRRNMVVTDSVIDSDNSLVIQQAANREISATVVLKRMLDSIK